MADPRRPGPEDVPAEARELLREIGYFDPDPLAPGDPAPDVALFTPTGEEVRLSRWWRDRPVVLVFGSYT